ncbi:MAG TPA: universal stress protein, partial [Polyangiaceae bacterium]|nr:universal stress protein [Polyangiaceae bacterium]
PESNHSELRDFIAASERTHLQNRAKELLGDIEHSVEVAWGRPSLAVIRRVLWSGHDLVIKVARGRESGRRLYFGSTAMHLMRKCPCPVWIVGAQPDSAPTILAAIDPGMPTDLPRALFARRILERAQRLARTTGARLHVAHAWDTGRLHALRVRRNPIAAKNIEKARAAAARSAVQAVVDGDETLHLLRGPADEVIPLLARQLQAHTIVIGSVGRSGISGILIGEMAEEILSRVDCGVLCVKPDGFVCPVRPAVPAASAEGVALPEGEALKRIAV